MKLFFKILLTLSMALMLALQIGMKSANTGLAFSNKSSELGELDAVQDSSQTKVRTMVIAPLANVYQLGDWKLFRSQLAKLKAIGVDAISTDVWWHHFQPNVDAWDWGYYLQYVDAINASGLKWVPIISLHWVPDWVWADYPDAKFVNEYNESSDMYMSFWHPQTRNLIANAISKFFETFAPYNQTIYAVYVAAGMWGELQYPWMLNTTVARSAFYGYDQNAKIDFSNQMKDKYVTIENANTAWQTTFQNWSQVEPPLPNTTFPEMWQDFLWWYNSTLVGFEDWLLNTTRQSYSGLTLMKLSMTLDLTSDEMLGHLDYDAILSTMAKYKAIPTCTFSEDQGVTAKFANLSRTYSLPRWGENAGVGADLNVVLDDLITNGYHVFSYLRMDDLFQNDAHTDLPTSRYYDFAGNITEFESIDIQVPNEYSTIQEAINNANDGDKILVYNGTYSAAVINRSITLQGECEQASVIEGGTAWGGTESSIVVASNNVTISGFTIRHAEGPGVLVCGDFGVCYSNVTIDGNVVTDNGEGIRLVNTTNDVITNNILSDDDGGIVFDWANDTIVYDNLLLNVSVAISGGYPSYGNTFFENTIESNFYGVMFNDTFQDYRFFHNNFLNDTMQVSLMDGAKVGAWDNGYPSGGNYWSDYNGTDTNDDGIGDAPYTINANSTDNHPLMNPWAPPTFTVTSLTTAKTFIGEGYTETVNATCENQGNKIEDFDCVFYANSSIICFYPEEAFPMTIRTIGFVWNTTGLPYGNYTVMIYVAPSDGETSITNDNFPVTIHIGVPGDVSSSTPGVYDGVTNMKDIAYLVSLYQTKPTKPPWYPDADVNDDGVVDMKDIAIAVYYFNQHE